MKTNFFENLSFELEKIGKGKALVSEPFLPDPNFNRTVILIIEHNHEGSLGFVLNRDSDHNLNDVVEGFPDFESKIFVGGPVGTDQLFFLHTNPKNFIGGQEVMPNLFWGGNLEKLKLLMESNEISNQDIRFFIGYSGWSPGQLAQELKEKSWIVTSLTSEEVLIQSQDFWQKTMQSLGTKFEIMANFPEDPRLN